MQYSDWDQPTLKKVHDHNTSYDSEENIISVGVSKNLPMSLKITQH